MRALILRTDSLTRYELEHLIAVLKYLMSHVNPTGNDIIDFMLLIKSLMVQKARIFNVIGEKVKNENTDSIIFSTFSIN